MLNTIAWFQIGEFTNAAGTVFHGDINRFYAGDGTAGMFMSGFFPIMMFGLPGAALAMYLAAPKASSDGWRDAAFCCCYCVPDRCD